VQGFFRGIAAWAPFFAGASLLMMVVNDNSLEQDKRGALEGIVSKLAPTGTALASFRGIV
jgi:hypothetical protein